MMRFDSSIRASWTHLAPFIAGYNELNLWAILQIDYNKDMRNEVQVTTYLRFSIKYFVGSGSEPTRKWSLLFTADQKPEKTVLTAKGMVYSFCAQGIEKKLKIKNVQVDLDHLDLLCTFGTFGDSGLRGHSF